MEKRTCARVVIIFVLFLLTSMFTLLAPQAVEAKSLIQTQTLISHSPIIIDSESDFILENGVVGGSGTEADPYIIEGWDINLYGTGYGVGIYVANTASFFVIRSVYVHDEVLVYGRGGIEFYNLANGAVEKSRISQVGYYGITIGSSIDCKITNNTIENQRGYGISLGVSHSCTIAKNNITNIEFGIVVTGSSDNSMTANNVIKNDFGIFIYAALGDPSSNNRISENTIEENGLGLHIFADGNRVYHNNFNNTMNVEFLGINTWDNGYPSGGNYWSNYAGPDEKSGPYQNETGSDGIGDTPFVIDANNTDNYPLMQLWSTQTHYSVSFTESGLPSGTIWSVTLNGDAQSTSEDTILFQVECGHYQFSITPIPGLSPSPTDEGWLQIDDNTTLLITWLSQALEVRIEEVGLPASTSWSTTYGYITKTSTTPRIYYLFPMSGGTYSFSATCSGYIAEPSPFTANVSGASTKVVFIPVAHAAHFAFWDPFKDSYSSVNPSTTWSAGGNCYGLSSTALLYFMRNTLCQASYPYFPSQNPEPTTSTSDLNLGSDNTLNNASLAVMFHQCYGHIPIPKVEFVDKSKEYLNLVGNLTLGEPVLISLGNAINYYHAVVAWGVGTLQNGSCAIAIYDPNFPQSTQVAIYDSVSNTFSYSATPGPFDRFAVSNAAVITTSMAPVDWWWFGTYWWWKDWLSFNATDYFVVIAEKNVTIDGAGLLDTFSEMGNSQTFVRGIPGSSGIEEGNVQVYAIPEDIPFTVYDPDPSNSSVMFFGSVEKVSGQCVGHSYLLNVTTGGKLDFNATPSNTFLEISAGTDAINVSVTVFTSTYQDLSISQSSTVQINPTERVNFTDSYLRSVAPSKTVVGKGYGLHANVSIVNAGNNANITYIVYANSTAIYNDTVIGLPIGELLKTFGNNCSELAYGNYTLKAVAAIVQSGNYTADNNCTDSIPFHVGVPGDISGPTQGVYDRTCNMRDIQYLILLFNTNPSSPNWKPNADINNDATVNMRDIQIAILNFNKHE